MNNKKIVKVDQDTSIAWAFHFMGRDYMSIDELNNYLVILKSILPEGYVLFGVNNAIDFILERYPNVFSCDGNIIYITLTPETKQFFNTNSNNIELFRGACDILKAIEETTGEIMTKDNMSLKKTI